MDALKLHLLLNYYPAIALIIGTLIFVGGIRFKSVSAQQFALKMIIFFALFTLAVVLTGEIASHPVELYAGARADTLRSHKLTARIAFAMVVATGIAALIALRDRRRPESGKWAYTIFLILAVISSVLLVTTILKGRQVKWTVESPDMRPGLQRSIDTEKKIWHA
ncbi:MAG: hypothetical protein ABI646_03590 [Acidobacteriota bacterium]